MLVVTGANGFLGSYIVCELLKSGRTVKAFKRENSDLVTFKQIAKRELASLYDEKILNLTWSNVDIEDILSLDDELINAEIVFHCAAVVSFNGNKSRLIQVNAGGTANVVNACLKNGVKRLVYASSTAALGRSDSQKLIHEDTQWTEDKNNTMYAESKHLAELEVWRGAEEGLDAVVVNPGIILGAGDSSKGSSRLFTTIKKGFKFFTKGINGFVGVKDVSRIMVDLAFSEVKNERFVLVSENLSYQKLFSLMAKGFNTKEPSIEIKPQYLVWIKWIFKINALLNPKTNLSVETLQTSLKVHEYDNSKIKSLGYKLTPISEVVAETCVNMQE